MKENIEKKRNYFKRIYDPSGSDHEQSYLAVIDILSFSFLDQLHRLLISIRILPLKYLQIPLER